MILTAPFVMSCATNGPQTETECAWAEPIILQPEDVDAIDVSTARQILDHNELYERFCEGDAD